jgi:pyrroloquinoline quinone biosynthesis protein E
MDRPFGLLAELTYGCPLSCPYCSNPLNLADYRDELTTAEWQRVLTEAQELGVLQLHLSGGEPLLRRDVVEIVNSANELGLYTNLITSALGLSRRRAEQLRAAGLDHVQISIQADEAAVSDRIAGTPSFERKIEAARVVKKLGWPLTLNVVLHRQNIDRVADILRLAEELEADRIELANTQYYGWAWRNRDTLLPSKAQLERAEAVVRAARVRLQGRMDVIYVLPDYYSQPYPCRSCDRREIDFGGCRCQAFQLTGDAARTDPVCHLSPDHGIVAETVQAANEGTRPGEGVIIPRPHRARSL